MMPIVEEKETRRNSQRLPDDNDTAAEGIEEPRRGRKSSSRRTKSASKSKSRSLRTGGGLHVKVSEAVNGGTRSKRESNNQEDHFGSTGGDVLLAEARAQISQQQEQLVALKVHNRDLEEELKTEKAKNNEDRYRKKFERLEEENLDMQHDLAETRKIKDRLEKENHVNGKKLIKREAENTWLRDQIDTLSGRTGDETNEDIYDEADYEQSIPERNARELERSSRSSVWKLLAEETVPESPVCSRAESRGSIFESFFKSSEAPTSSLADLSLTTDSRSSHCRSDGMPPDSPPTHHDGSRSSFRHPQGGFVPAA
jgi:hypothetical protein